MVPTPTKPVVHGRYSPAMTDLIEFKTLSLAAADQVAHAAVEAATADGLSMCICIADLSGEPIVTLRMDGAPRLSASIAANKAWSVASFGGMPTHAWWGAIENEPTLVHGLTHTPRLVIFGGGLPLMADGQMVGAIGVSGGTADQDRAVAEAAAASLS
jgi:glc operon protein GlcG